MFCENIMTLVGWMCKNYNTFGLFNMYCSSLFIFYFHFFPVIDLYFFFSIYIKRANRLINSIMNSIFGLVTCLFSLFFSFKFTNLVWACFFSFKGSLCVYFLLVRNVSLHCIHTKNSKYYIHCNYNVYFYIYIKSEWEKL